MAEKRITWDLLSSLITQLWAKIKANFTNKIESIKVNGAMQAIGSDKSVNITIPTQKTKLSEFTNDKGFITKVVNDLEHYYKKAEVDSKLSAIPKFKIEVVTKLPTTGISETTVYLLKNAKAEDNNLYAEYIYVNGKWEKLGEQTIDLSGYLKETTADSKYANISGRTKGQFSVGTLHIGENDQTCILEPLGDEDGINFHFVKGSGVTLRNLADMRHHIIAFLEDIPEPANEAEMQQLLNSLD